MGKAIRWFKGLLGLKKEKDHYGYSGSLASDKNEKKRSGKDEVSHLTPTSLTAFDPAWSRSYVADDEKNKPAIDVAVVRLRSYDRDMLFNESRERCAAVKIQSFFRGYLARKALGALKGLVKIQALVRGYVVRKRVAATLHSMEAMIRAQAVARSQRARRSLNNKTNIFHPDFCSRKNAQLFDETRNELHMKRLPIYCKTPSNGFNESPKVVEIDTHMPHSRSRSLNTTMSECGEDLQYQAISSSLLPCQVPGRISIHDCHHPQEFDWYLNVDEANRFSTARSTPRLANCMLPNASATPTKSVCRDSFFGPFSKFPNYMANTKSSKAKLRSHSAPKQRPELKKRPSLNEMMTARNSISGFRMEWSSNPKSQDYYSFDKVI